MSTIEIDLEEIFHYEVYKAIKEEAKRAKLPIELYVFLEYQKLRAPHLITPLEDLVSKNAPYYKSWQKFVKTLQKEDSDYGKKYLKDNLEEQKKENPLLPDHSEDLCFWEDWEDIPGRALTALEVHFKDKTLGHLQKMSVAQLKKLENVGAKTAKWLKERSLEEDE